MDALQNYIHNSPTAVFRPLLPDGMQLGSAVDRSLLILYVNVLFSLHLLLMLVVVLFQLVGAYCILTSVGALDLCVSVSFAFANVLSWFLDASRPFAVVFAHFLRNGDGISEVRDW